MIIPSLLEALKNLGIKPGSTLCVSSNVARFGIPNEIRQELKTSGPGAIMQAHVDTLLACLGPEGNLIMPTFTYSACQNQEFDLLRTPSTVGSLTEWFRQRPNVVRSLHPIFSFAAQGPRAKELMQVVDFNCFGEDSLFGRLLRENAHYLMYGVAMGEGATYVYYSEQRANVPYRYIKYFPATMLDQQGKKHQASVPYFVRNYDIPYEDAWSNLQDDSIQAGISQSTQYHQVPLLAHRASQIDQFILQSLKKNPDYLIRRLPKT